MSDTIEKLTEFETKYRVEPNQKTQFKSLAGTLPNLKKFVYVEGPDFYYTRPDGSFARYRQPAHGLDHNRCELTFKVKPEGAKNNIVRKEVNWRVDITPMDSIVAGLEMLGYKPNFSIWKECHIYNLSDATLVFYTVYDITDGGKASKTEEFLEIELNEETIHELTHEQAMGVIVKYEKILEPLGLSPQRRLRKSLFEMYVRER